MSVSLSQFWIGCIAVKRWAAAVEETSRLPKWSPGAKCITTSYAQQKDMLHFPHNWYLIKEQCLVRMRAPQADQTRCRYTHGIVEPDVGEMIKWRGKINKVVHQFHWFIFFYHLQKIKGTFIDLILINFLWVHVNALFIWSSTVKHFAKSVSVWALYL